MASAVRRVEEDAAQAWRRRKKLMLGDKREGERTEPVPAPFLARQEKSRGARPDDKNGP